jgi:HAD superfamily hydrolase (TIGR01509 family)
LNDELQSSPWGVIFDNDGVLVDSEHVSIKAYEQALAEQGVRPDELHPHDYCGLTDADIIEMVQKEVGHRLDGQQFAKRKQQLYYKLADEDGVKALPGAEELVRKLRECKVPVALASSGSKEKIRFNLSKTTVKDDFDAVITGEDFERGKPDPQIFLAAASKIGIEPARCAVLEDSINGLKGARAAGMLAIGITNSFPADALKPHADVVVSTLEDLSPTKILGLLDQQN